MLPHINGKKIVLVIFQPKSAMVDKEIKAWGLMRMLYLTRTRRGGGGGGGGLGGGKLFFF